MKRRTPFWLQEGTETCAACSQTYHIVVERRCAACDRGVCEHCAVTVQETREVLCTGCAAEEAG